MPRKQIRAFLSEVGGHSKMTSPQNWEFQTSLSPLSPLVTILVDPPFPYVTGANSDKLFSVTGIIKKMKLSQEKSSIIIDKEQVTPLDYDLQINFLLNTVFKVFG